MEMRPRWPTPEGWENPRTQQFMCTFCFWCAIYQTFLPCGSSAVVEVQLQKSLKATHSPCCYWIHRLIHWFTVGKWEIFDKLYWTWCKTHFPPEIEVTASLTKHKGNALKENRSTYALAFVICDYFIGMVSWTGILRTDLKRKVHICGLVLWP